jgi:hypothetical protein
MFANNPRPQQANSMQDQSTPDTRPGPRDALNALEGVVAGVGNILDPNKNPIEEGAKLFVGLAFASAGLPGGSPKAFARELMKQALKP